jgi:hypothetical protein
MFDTPRDVSWGVFVDPALQCDFVDRGDWIEIGVPAGPGRPTTRASRGS